MIFSSNLFLYIFLPIFAINYALWPNKNLVLVIASLCFYSWGEPTYIFLLLFVCLVNALIAKFIEPSCANRKAALILGVGFNIVILLIFKYLGFFLTNLNVVLAEIGFQDIVIIEPKLPLGISFFLFQAITYLVDIYRGHCTPARKASDVILYISLFPQLVAGPIVRYEEIYQAIKKRSSSWKRIVAGTERFIYGLGKKVLIADQLAKVVDEIYALPATSLTPELAWAGTICFALQIYFDFSGYSDMAIGIGKAIGFDFPENFNYPYVAKSIQEFWRRWHMTLSRWFRDYVYIPLGGNRKSAARTYVNLLIVFVLTGFWHGAAWTYLIWGLIHGFFLVLERVGLSKVLAKVWAPVAHLYIFIVITLSWVFFRAESLNGAITMIKTMLFLSPGAVNAPLFREVFSPHMIFVIFVGFAISLGAGRWAVENIYSSNEDDIEVGWIKSGALLAIMVLAMAGLATESHQAFIYFRF